jgi:hypothetical protein
MTNQTSPSLTINTTEPKPRGFPGLCCLKCGEADGCQFDLLDCDRVYCVHCEAELSLRDDIAPLLAAWQRVLDWAALAPVAE